MRRALTIIVAAAFGALVFSIAWEGIDYVNSTARDRQRISDAKILRNALARHRNAVGKYPAPFQDADVFLLKDSLVSRNFLDKIPQDPLWAGTGKNYRYISLDGDTYAIWVHLERAHGMLSAGGNCLIGVGFADTGWYGFGGKEPPECPF